MNRGLLEEPFTASPAIPHHPIAPFSTLPSCRVNNAVSPEPET